jgi:hypothetical protein
MLKSFWVPSLGDLIQLHCFSYLPSLLLSSGESSFFCTSYWTTYISPSPRKCLIGNVSLKNLKFGYFSTSPPTIQNIQYCFFPGFPISAAAISICPVSHIRNFEVILEFSLLSHPTTYTINYITEMHSESNHISSYTLLTSLVKISIIFFPNYFSWLPVSNLASL